MENQPNQENTSFNDQSELDSKFDKSVSTNRNQNQGSDFSNEDRAEQQVRENEDASLQDSSYSFDEDNTDNEEYHDAYDVGDYDSDDADISGPRH